MTERRELLLGCGHRRTKILLPPGASTEWENLTTLDNNRACNPDIYWDLDAFPWPLLTDYYDEIHAYEVLEHLGSQGNLHAFFAHFYAIWDALKPGGYLCATTPSRFGPWLWGDPGHRRAILPESVAFLDRATYVQVGHTALSDYRDAWLGDFKIIYSNDDKRATHGFVLQAVKPIRA
jgi:hypothetical protein